MIKTLNWLNYILYIYMFYSHLLYIMFHKHVIVNLEINLFKFFYSKNVPNMYSI